mgnify:CR=1 FL=1
MALGLGGCSFAGRWFDSCITVLPLCGGVEVTGLRLCYAMLGHPGALPIGRQHGNRMQGCWLFTQILVHCVHLAAFVKLWVCVRHLGMQCEPLFQTDSAHEPTSVVVWWQLHVGYALWECAGKPLKEKGPYLPTLLHSTLAVWLQP